MTQSQLRYPMLVLAMMALLAAIWAGLLRLGWRWPLLHLSLLTRILGDLMISQPLRLWGGLLNGIALLLFILLNAYSVVKGKRMQATSPPTPVEQSLPATQE